MTNEINDRQTGKDRKKQKEKSTFKAARLHSESLEWYNKDEALSATIIPTACFCQESATL